MEMRQMYAACLAELMGKDRHVVVLDADLARASGTRGLYERFPKQMFDCGIAEQNMASIAAGLASYGFKPWIETFAPFATRRICDQVTLSIVYAGLNVKIVGTDPGIAAELNGGTHMSLEDVGIARSVPGLSVFEPADATQLKAAMPLLNDYPHPLYMRMVRKELPAIFGEDYHFDLMKADILREGTDITLVTAGLPTVETLAAAGLLAKEGIEAEVICVHMIKPIDRETLIRSARRSGCVLTVENHNIYGGLFDAVLEALAAERVPVFALGAEDRFGEVGKLPYLKEVMGLTAENIAARAKAALGKA